MQLSADALQTYTHIVQSGMLSAVVLQHLFQEGSELALRPKPWAQVKDPIAALIL